MEGPKIVTFGDMIQGERVFQPYPITAKDFSDGIIWGQDHGVDTQQARAQADIKRMLEIYERHRAWFQPTPLNGKLQWTVRFPKLSKWKSGPTRPDADKAFIDNYLMNKKFAGEQELDKGDGNGMIDMDKIIDQALRDDDSRRADAVAQLEDGN